MSARPVQAHTCIRHAHCERLFTPLKIVRFQLRKLSWKAHDLDYIYTGNIRMQENFANIANLQNLQNLPVHRYFTVLIHCLQ